MWQWSIRNAAIFSSTCYDVYTYRDTERTHETERMQIEYIKKLRSTVITRKWERHKEGNSQITENKILVAEFLKISENSNEVLGKTDQIERRETFSLKDSI